jgi:hypothetical protein
MRSRANSLDVTLMIRMTPSHLLIERTQASGEMLVHELSVLFPFSGESGQAGLGW